MEKLLKNSTSCFTVGEAVEIYKNGISLTVNEGKDIILGIEKEPTRSPAK